MPKLPDTRLFLSNSPFDPIVRAFLAFKIMLFTVLVPGTVAIYLPYWLLSNSGGNLQPINAGLTFPTALGMIIGTIIYLRCAWDFAIDGLGTPAPLDPPKKLVISGLYCRTRNPMYQGILILLFAECLLFQNLGLIVYVSAVALVLHAFVVYYEEPGLHNRFGISYTDYCRQVPRWGFALRPFVGDAA